MKVYKGVSASPGLVLGQVSRLEHHVETFSHGPFNPERELRLLANAVHTAQNELDSMAERAAPTEQAIFLFQSMMLDDEGMMNEVRFCINAGISASAAMHQVGQRYADQLANMKDNPYMQLRSVDILDATRRVINILTNRPRVWLALDHPVILAADRLMPTDLFSVPSGMILGVITAEGSGQSHAAIIARAMNIPGIVQVGKDFLDDCDGRTVILDATNGNCILDPDAAARQQAEASICQLQREDAEMKQLHSLPDETRDGEPFELLANCFGPEDIDTAMQSGAKGVGLLRSGYMMLPGRILDEQEQYFFYCSCLAAANGCPVTVRTFDFGSDRTVADANQGPQSSKLGLRGIRNSLRQPQQFQTQICALLRGELCLPVALRPGYETLYDRTFTCRPDSPKGLVRYQESRLYSCFGSTVQPDNCVERRRRCVTMDNIGYGRYSGEIQLMRADLPADEKVNVIGEVPAEYDLLLDCIKRGKTFRMVKTS